MSEEKILCYVCKAAPLNFGWTDELGTIDCVTCMDSGNQPVPFTELLDEAKLGDME